MSYGQLPSKPPAQRETEVARFVAGVAAWKRKAQLKRSRQVGPWRFAYSRTVGPGLKFTPHPDGWELWIGRHEFAFFDRARP